MSFTPFSLLTESGGVFFRNTEGTRRILHVHNQLGAFGLSVRGATELLFHQIPFIFSQKEQVNSIITLGMSEFSATDGQ